MAVDHQDPPRRDRILWNIVDSHDERRITIPEDRAIAGASVDEDDGELVRGARDNPRRAHVDAGRHQAFAREHAEVVVAKAADVARAPAETRTGDRGGRHLPAWKPGKSLQTLLRIRCRVFGDDRDQVDAVEAETDRIEGFLASRRNSKRDPHGARIVSAEPAARAPRTHLKV